MDKDKIQELLRARAQAEQELEKMRSPVTILFSDIKGSTPYFEKKGDLAGLAMVERHNGLLIPMIEEGGGRVVKTFGDGIMACFKDPVAAVQAAAAMQRVLEVDRIGRPESEQIHIRIGLHTGLGLFKDGDVFGDVVNAASRVQHQAQPDQIVITNVLLEAARAAGLQYAKLGKAELKGKDEPIDLYAVAWSDSANEQLIEEIQSQYERKLKDMKRIQDQLEEELEVAREQWRTERRRMTSEIEELEESVERARDSARQQAAETLHSELRFQLQEALSARQLAEQQLAETNAKWEAENSRLKAHIASMQATVIEAMERSNNPTRMALAIREQADARIKEASEEWQLKWEGERKRFTAEIERLKKSKSVTEQKKETARRALLEKLGKVPAGSLEAPKSAEYWEREYEDARIRWESERDQLQLKMRKLERTLADNTDTTRSDIYQEMRASYEPKLAEEKRERLRVEQELATAAGELASERRRLNARIEQLEQSIPEAQEAVRQQITAELQADFEIKLDEFARVRARMERRLQDMSEEFESERRRDKKHIAQLEQQLKEAREAAFKSQRNRIS
jgi:class 3 adenylate cyclase